MLSSEGQRAPRAQEHRAQCTRAIFFYATGILVQQHFSLLDWLLSLSPETLRNTDLLPDLTLSRSVQVISKL